MEVGGGEVRSKMIWWVPFSIYSHNTNREVWQTCCTPSGSICFSVAPMQRFIHEISRNLASPDAVRLVWSLQLHSDSRLVSPLQSPGRTST